MKTTNLMNVKSNIITPQIDLTIHKKQFTDFLLSDTKKIHEIKHED